jgi:amino acid transporter
VLTLLCYSIPILAIMLVLPASQITGLGGFLDAMKTVFTVYGGHVDAKGAAHLSGLGTVFGDVIAVGFVWALATSGAAWIMSADRAQAVAGYDGAAPRFMGRISERFGTPVVVNMLTGVMATIVMVLAFQITGGNAGKYFSTVLNLAISTTTITYMPMFLAAIALRYNRYRDVPRPYRVPFGNVGMWICVALTVGFCLLGTASTIWPGIGTSNPDAALPAGWEHQRFGFELAQIVPLLVMGAIGVLFYFVAAPTRRGTVVVEEAPAPAPVAG